jgi:hypothetical protein
VILQNTNLRPRTARRLQITGTYISLVRILQKAYHPTSVGTLTESLRFSLSWAVPNRRPQRFHEPWAPHR